MEANSNFTSKPYVIRIIKRKPTSVKNPQTNAILEWVHQVIMAMLRTAEINMADSVDASDIDTFLTNVAWAICPTIQCFKSVQAWLFLVRIC